MKDGSDASSEGKGDRRYQSSGERIVVALIPSAAGALQRLKDRTGLTEADLANRAIASYEFFDSSMRAGYELILRDAQTGETKAVRFL